MAAFGFSIGIGGSPVPTGGTITSAIPAGYSAASFTGAGTARFGGVSYAITVTFAGSNFSFVWPGPPFSTPNRMTLDLDLANSGGSDLFRADLASTATTSGSKLIGGPGRGTVADWLTDLTPEAFGAKGDLVKLTDLTISGGALGVATSASANFTSADIGKMIIITGAGTAPGGTVNSIAYSTSVAPHYTTIASINSANSVNLTAPATQAVSGVTGAYATDDSTPIRNMFLLSGVTGRAIRFSGRGYGVGKPIDHLANTTVYCAGEIMLFADATAAGGFLLIKNNDDNIAWFGGTINGGELTNMNGIAAAYDPGTNNFSRNIRFIGTRVIGCRTNPAMHGASAFAGGGKGVTAQFHIDGFLFDGVVDGCDIGLSVEGATNNNQFTSNVRIRGLIKNCPYAAMFVGGSFYTSSTTLPTYATGQLGEANIDVTIDNCATIAAVGSVSSQIWANLPTHLTINARVRNGNGAGTPTDIWKGNIGSKCVVNIEATCDNIADVIDLSPYTGASLASATSFLSKITVDAASSNAITGAVLRGNNLESRIAVEVLYSFASTPSTLSTNFNTSATNSYKFTNKSIGSFRFGYGGISTSNINADPYRLDVSYVTFGKLSTHVPQASASTLPSGSQVALASGAMGVSDGSAAQGDGWGGGGPGPYVHRASISKWGRIVTRLQAISFVANATLDASHYDVVLDNKGTSARVDLTLPTFTSNARGQPRIRAMVISANGIRLVAPTGVVIIIPGVGSSTSGGYAQCTTVGGNIELMAVLDNSNNFIWVATGGFASGWTVA